MPSYLDNRVTMTVYLDGSGVGKKSFTLPLLLAHFANTKDAITVVNTVTKKFTVAGDRTAEAITGRTLLIKDSTGNNGRYTVVSAVYATGFTTIEVSEAVSDSTADGKLIFTQDYKLTTADHTISQITVAGFKGVTADVPVGSTIRIYGSTSNDGLYTVATALVAGGTLTITTTESLTDSTADGGVMVWGTGSVYRLYSNTTALTNDASIIGTIAAAEMAVGFNQIIHTKQEALGFWGLMDDAPKTALDRIVTAGYDAFFGVVISSRTQGDIIASSPDTTSLMAFMSGKKKITTVQQSIDDIKNSAYDPTATLPDDDTGSVLKVQNLENVHPIWHGNDSELQDWALMCNRLSVDPDKDSTIWSNVTLRGITDQRISDTVGANLDGKNVNYYDSMGGTPCTGKGVMSNGKKADEVVMKYWLAARGAEVLAGVLLEASNRGQKVPYTDNGVQAFRGPCEAIMEQGVNANHFTEGTTRVVLPLVSEIPEDQQKVRRYIITMGGWPASAVEEVDASAYISIDFVVTL